MARPMGEGGGGQPASLVNRPRSWLAIAYIAAIVQV